MSFLIFAGNKLRLRDHRVQKGKLESH